MNLFEWLGLKKVVDDLDQKNVVKFPAPKAVPNVPEPEKPANIFYRIGTTDKNRISFQMGYSEITMNREGVDNLIRQLEVFRDQLVDEENSQ